MPRPWPYVLSLCFSCLLLALRAPEAAPAAPVAPVELLQHEPRKVPILRITGGA